MIECSTVLRLVYLNALLAWVLQAQPAQPTNSPNHVLELDGTNSYVHLPPNIFTNLTEATVEVWAKWDAFQSYSRIFEFGERGRSMKLINLAATSDLRFDVDLRDFQEIPAGERNSIRVSNLVRAKEWIHLAAVSGPGGMKLYANGVLVGTHPAEFSFADIRASQTNVLGRGLYGNPGDQAFRGQMDELRVWNHPRTEEQIRENMFQRLSGTETGLVGLWNFENVGRSLPFMMESTGLVPLESNQASTKPSERDSISHLDSRLTSRVQRLSRRAEVLTGHVSMQSA